MKRSTTEPKAKKPAAKKSAARKAPVVSAANINSGAIRQRNVEKIVKAAAEAFSRKGFAGTSTADIAQVAGVPKANLHYYFRTKSDLYSAVLVDIADAWNDALTVITPDADPAAALTIYITHKMKAAQTSPVMSRLWANEMIAGAPHVLSVMKSDQRKLLDQKCAAVQSWIDAGKIKPIAPKHLFFMLWSMTQTYADFAVQIETMLGKKSLDNATFKDATETALTLILGGLGLERVMQDDAPAARVSPEK